MKKISRSFLFLALLLVLTVSACAPRQPLGEEFEIGYGQSVVVSGTWLKITAEDIGKEWRFGPDDADGEEWPYAVFNIKLGIERKRVELEPGDDMSIGEFNIHVRGCNPFGEAYCSLLVTKK